MRCWQEVMRGQNGGLKQVQEGSPASENYHTTVGILWYEKVLTIDLRYQKHNTIQTLSIHSSIHLDTQLHI